MKVVRLSALRTAAFTPHEIFLVLISVKGWVDPTAIMRPEGFIHLVVCLTTGPKLLPKRALHIVRSKASSFKWEYSLLSLRSSNSFLRLLPCLPVTSIPPCIFPSVTRCRRQFRRKMWPIQFAFRLLISCRIFLCSLTLSNTYGRIMSMKKFNETFGNRTRDLPSCSAVPQPTAPTRAPPHYVVSLSKDTQK